jgi:hypothetical protein
VGAVARLGGPHGRLLGRTAAADGPFTIHVRARDRRLLRRGARVWLSARLVDGPRRARTVAVR